MKNKLCCVLNPYVKNRSKRYCATCVKKELRSGIKQMDWDKVARQIVKSQEDYLFDGGGRDGWMEGFYEYYEDDSFDRLIKKVVGPYVDDDIHEQVSGEAREYYESLLEKTISRVKIVVT